MDFIAIDIETANPNLSSICQIGIASFEGGSLSAEWKSYVDPKTWFAPLNVRLSGIDESTVSGAPTLPDLEPILRSHLEGRLVVSHTHFDRVAICQAFTLHSLAPLNCRWLDSARVARRTWSQLSGRGYGLANLCELIGYDFAPHDALEDAKAAGYVMLRAIETSGLTAEEWLDNLRRRPTSSRSRFACEGNPDGPLCGEVIVFTGALQFPRKVAAKLAAEAGCEVADNVTKETTLLVVGDQDLSKLAGHDKSSKHRKAEALMAKGQPIRILCESDFAELVALDV